MYPKPADIEETIRAFLASRSDGIAAAYLFGSTARGTARPNSDVDVGVLYVQAPPLTFEGLPLELEGDLERVVGKPVQVVVLNRASPDLVHRVLRDGRLILESDRSVRVRFEVRSRNEFFDVLPTLLRYRRLPHGDA